MKISLPDQIIQDAQLSCCGKEVMRQKAVTQSKRKHGSKGLLGIVSR